MKSTNYTAPPASAIAAHMRCDMPTAKKARALMKGEICITDNPDFPKTNSWISACYHKPRRIDLILSALNELLECHGVEAFRARGDQYHALAEYLNTGDAYSATVLFRHDTGTFRLTTWGDFIERNEKRLGGGVETPLPHGRRIPGSGGSRATLPQALIG